MIEIMHASHVDSAGLAGSVVLTGDARLGATVVGRLRPPHYFLVHQKYST